MTSDHVAGESVPVPNNASGRAMEPMYSPALSGTYLTVNFFWAVNVLEARVLKMHALEMCVLEMRVLEMYASAKPVRQ